MDMTPFPTFVALAAICVLSVCMRLFPVVLWGSVRMRLLPLYPRLLLRLTLPSLSMVRSSMSSTRISTSA